MDTKEDSCCDLTIDKDDLMLRTAYNICHKMWRESLHNLKLIISLKFTWNSADGGYGLSNLNGGFGGAPSHQMFSHNSFCYGRTQAYIAECEFRTLEVTLTPRSIWTRAHSPNCIKDDLFFVLSLAVSFLKSFHSNYLLVLCHWKSSREN